MSERSSYAPGTPCWVDVSSPDVSASAAFYAGLFGWDIVDLGPDAGGYSMCAVRGKNVAGIGPHQDPNSPPAWTTYIASANADATAETAKAAGGMVVLEPFDVFDAGRMCFFIDAAGAFTGVWQAGQHIGAQLVNEPGALCWNELTCRDIEGAKAFYKSVFGWDGVASDAGGFEYVEWQLDGQSVAGMMPMSDAMPSNTPSHWTTYFAVADCDASITKVGALGGGVVVPPMDSPPGRFAVVSDPFGVSFGIIALAS